MKKPSIFVADCEILAHQKFAGEQFILTIKSAEVAKNTRPGQFVHISINDDLLRRPFSIMTIDVKNSSFVVLYKVVGGGSLILSKCQVGDFLSIMGPIGNGFKLSEKRLPLLIGGGVGMPPMIAMAQQIHGDNSYQPLVILGSEVEFPFALTDSKIDLHKLPKTKTMPLLESWGITCKLASLQGFDGVFTGLVTDLAGLYLDALSPNELMQVEIFTCGPKPMLAAVAKLAKNYNVPCQVSVEEAMACAVGGCAGCTVPVKIAGEIAMKRVCVDGPVFAAETVFFDD